MPTENNVGVQHTNTAEENNIPENLHNHQNRINQNNVSVQLTNTTEENNRKSKLYKHQNDQQNKEVELCKLILKIGRIDETVSNKTISQKEMDENNILQELCKLTARYLNNIDINSSKEIRYKLSIGLAFSALDFLNKKKDQEFQSSPSRNNCEQSIKIWNTWLMKQCGSVCKTSFYNSFNSLMKKNPNKCYNKYLLKYVKHRNPELFEKAKDMIQKQKSEDKPGKEPTSSVRRSSRLNNVKDTVQSKGHQVLRLVTETKRK